MSQRKAVNKHIKPLIPNKNLEAYRKHTQRNQNTKIKEIYSFDVDGNVINSSKMIPRPFYLERQTKIQQAVRRAKPDAYNGSYIAYRNWPLNWKIGQNSFRTRKVKVIDTGPAAAVILEANAKKSQPSKSTGPWREKTSPTKDWKDKMKRIKMKARR